MSSSDDVVCCGFGEGLLQFRNNFLSCLVQLKRLIVDASLKEIGAFVITYGNDQWERDATLIAALRDRMSNNCKAKNFFENRILLNLLPNAKEIILAPLRECIVNRRFEEARYAAQKLGVPEFYNAEVQQSFCLALGLDDLTLEHDRYADFNLARDILSNSGVAREDLLSSRPGNFIESRLESVKNENIAPQAIQLVA